MIEIAFADFVHTSWQALVTTTVMMTVAGLMIGLVLRTVSLQSWRLRSWLVAAVLLQGLMFYRSPLHLDWIESNVSGTSTAAVADESAVGALRATSVSGSRSAPGEANLSSIGSQQPPVDGAVSGKVSWSRIVLVVWMTVLVTLVCRVMIRYVRLVHMVKRLELAPPSWQDAWQSLAGRSTRTAAARRCRMVVSVSVGPLLLRGPTGYTLIVPRTYWQGLNEDQRRGVMFHELSHLERRDVWRQLAARTVAAIHWFNPVAWWALREQEQAAELACDQRIAEHGKRAAAGFASALLELIHWHQRQGTVSAVATGIGFQAMAAPPLSARISRLLNSPSAGDSLMKRAVLALMALALVVLSFFQIHFTAAQESEEAAPASQLRVVSEAVRANLAELAANLDRTDPTSSRLADLIDSREGELAIAGVLNQLAGEERNEAKADAVGRFVATHFQRAADQTLSMRPDHAPLMQHWVEESKRLAGNLQKMKSTTDELAERMDTSTDAGALFQRLLADPQAPAAILLFEMKNGGDAIGRFIDKAMEGMLVDRGDGTLQIVESRRPEAEKQIQRFEMAAEIDDKLRRQLPVWAAEFDDSDEKHQRLIGYLKNPLMATIVAFALSDDQNVTSPAAAVNDLFQQLESVSEETAGGLKVTDPKAWDHFQQMFAQVDHAADLLPLVRPRLTRLAQALSTEQPLAKRFAVQLRQGPVAVLVAAELPYAESDPGKELRALLDEVVTETDQGKLKINPQQEEDVLEKAKELLRVCREIRRHVIMVDETLAAFVDQKSVQEMGDAGRYLLLSEVRRFAERHRPEPLALMMEKLLTQTDNGRFRVREDRRDVIRQLVKQTEQIRSEADIDDF